MIKKAKTASCPQREIKRGFTLTEIAIVLGIIGLVLGMIWYSATAVYRNQKIVKAKTEILLIVQNIRALFASANSIGFFHENEAVCVGVVPKDMIERSCNGPGSLYNPFANGYTVIADTTDQQGFVITMTMVPQDACVALIMALAGPQRDPGLFVAQVDYVLGATGTPLTVSATPQAAYGPASGGIGGCNVGSEVMLSFGYRLK